MPENLERQLVKYLSDIYSLEQQALAQLRTAPGIAGEPTLARLFREHLEQTERQAEIVGARLEAHGASHSALKDAVMALGGKAFLAFARVQPDTPGKLAAHAYSYEALECAAYELLIRVADRAGDEATMEAARTIRDEERAMLERLGDCLAPAADASLGERERQDMARTVQIYLRDAHAIEAQSVELLEKAVELAGDPELERIYRDHLDETRGHARLVEAHLRELGTSTSVLKDAALRTAALNWSLFFRAQGDTRGKLAAFAYAVEHLEIAGYRLLRRVAERADSAPTVALCDRILAEERAMAMRVAGAFDRASAAALVAVGATR